MEIVHLISWVLIIMGTGFVVIGAVGLVRLPDFWSRLHGVSVLDSAGVLLIISGMAIYSGFNLISVKLLIIGIFLLITGPTASHAVVNAAYVSGSRPMKSNAEHNAGENRMPDPDKEI